MHDDEKTRILIPLDGSETGEAVLPALYPLIRAHRVESTLFHVAESPDEAARAQVYLEKRRKTLEGQGVTTRNLIGSGSPVEESTAVVLVSVAAVAAVLVLSVDVELDVVSSVPGSADCVAHAEASTTIKAGPRGRTE